MGFEVVLTHFWLAFVAVTTINGRYWWAGVQARIQARPELEPGYRRLYRGYLFWANVPWILMGVGILSGQVRWMFDFLEPRSGNPYVLAWWSANGAVLAAGTVWVLWGGGAEMLARHPGFAMVPEWSASKILEPGSNWESSPAFPGGMGADPHSALCRRAGVWRERLPRVARRLGHSGSSLSGEPGPWWAPYAVPVSPSGKRELRKQSDADRRCRRARRRNSPVVPCRPPAIVFPMGERRRQGGPHLVLSVDRAELRAVPRSGFPHRETSRRDSRARKRRPPPATAPDLATGPPPSRPR
jgi:hypothetical protein